MSHTEEPLLFPSLRSRRPRFTTAFKLTPQSLVTAAAADIKRKRSNWGKHPGPYEQLAFHPRHVRRGDAPADVLLRAVKSAVRDRATAKGERAAIYADVRILRAALRLAEERC